MTISEAAEQVLFGKNLEEKLAISSFDLLDTARPHSLKTPHSPTRPSELKLSEKGVRSSFPGVNVLDQDKPRGELLHFLANHELLASELMALVLLKFPDAHTEYRRGVFEAMREEQMHTLMYIRRMKECGVEFGQLPLNSYFWRLVSPMRSPMEFVTKLNLTFEQANLDFSHHYAQKFREVGDTGTAAVLEKIYQDEIGHVGHGIKWLREWKAPQKSDWNAYREGLELPFSASKAKGLAPYNPEARRKAGLNEDFITNLSVYSQSRGRNPVLHWFNSSAEAHALAEKLEQPIQQRSRIQDIEQDLEFLMLAIAKQDDMLLLRKLPSTKHLQSLREADIPIPELIAQDDPSLSERKLGGLIPWAWSPDASRSLKRFKEQLPTSVPHQWSNALPHHWFSKEIGLKLTEMVGIPSDSLLISNVKELKTHLLESTEPQRIKPLYSCSGREQLIYDPFSSEEHAVAAIEKACKLLKNSQSLIIEPERKCYLDFSVHYDLEGEKAPAQLKGFCLMKNSEKGQFQSAHVAHKWSALLSEKARTTLFVQTNFKELYHEIIPNLLPKLLPNYHGPVGIDAFLYWDKADTLVLRPVVEVNVRYTMGRLALELMRKLYLQKGSLHIQPSKKELPEDALALNDPASAKTLQAYWVS